MTGLPWGIFSKGASRDGHSPRGGGWGTPQPEVSSRPEFTRNPAVAEAALASGYLLSVEAAAAARPEAHASSVSPRRARMVCAPGTSDVPVFAASADKCSDTVWSAYRHSPPTAVVNVRQLRPHGPDPLRQAPPSSGAVPMTRVRILPVGDCLLPGTHLTGPASLPFATPGQALDPDPSARIRRRQTSQEPGWPPLP